MLEFLLAQAVLHGQELMAGRDVCSLPKSSGATSDITALLNQRLLLVLSNVKLDIHIIQLKVLLLNPWESHGV